MKVLIIGKHGQLASALAKSASEFPNLEIVSFDSRALNVLDNKQLAEVIEKELPEAVINTSAYHVVPLCEENPEKAFAVNAFAIKNLLNAVRKIKAVFVTFSTDYVFDGQKKSPYLETDSPAPLQIYGMSKYIGEQIALNYYDRSLVIRTNGVYGGKEGSAQKGGNFVLQILKTAQTQNRIEVADNQIVSPTYASDLAMATLALIEKKVPSGIYHLVNEGFCSWAQFAGEIINLAKLNVQIVGVDRSAETVSLKRPNFSALSNTKAKLYGIILPNWKEALRKYIDSISI